MMYDMWIWNVHDNSDRSDKMILKGRVDEKVDRRVEGDQGVWQMLDDEQPIRPLAQLSSILESKRKFFERAVQLPSSPIKTRRQCKG